MAQARKTITYQMPGAAEPQTAHLFEDRVERFQGYVAREGGTVLSVVAFDPTTALAGLRAALGSALVTPAGEA